ncbi:hypothetical protein GGTG_07854 [Gaeumannomyces tritici R3-111a-1]|uniref:DUF1996 domain-containing protein n=1 Tax=Gaeumannomyces tritici (strain R3-111a-1) TaxID=644352 RepID=J3P2W2_GAET3|nr:hypothetical protein GGTG_07854 [Gaeumannomyces tritici R3-111a-1]EJT74004.1 hypothetical protein GGTG_07854 [Gaeumannomyces tritici R3-111a-1]
MRFSTLAAAGSVALCVDAFWRMECRVRSGLARIDPLVSPGEVAQHVHSIHGSGGFGPSATYDDLMNSDCTSCAVEQDKSAYWHPSIYFRDAATGKYELVEQKGGMLAYYLLFKNSNEDKVTAYPKGFRMIAGDTTRRNYSTALGDVNKPDPEKSIWSILGQTSQTDLQQRALGFNCLNYGKAPEGSLYRHFLPDKAYLDANCANGVRFELMFPSCWDGQNVDSENHRDHVAYPDLVMTGTCPESHPKRLISLFYETIWDTYAFKGRDGQFVISNGDVSGFGYHGDFMTGWDVNFLQQAADQCTNPSGRIEDCPLFKIQDDAKSAQCGIKMPDAIKTEQLLKGLDALPGNVAIQVGPAPAVPNKDPNPAKPPPPPSAPPAPVLSYKPGETATASGTYLPGQVFKATEPVNAGVAAETAAPEPSPQPEPVPPVVAAEASTPAPPPPPPVQPSTSSTPAPPPTTPAPPPPPPAPTSVDTASYVSTQYITEGNVVRKILWTEEIKYVTEYDDTTTTITAPGAANTGAAAPQVRRQLRHLRHHARHHV